MPVGTIAPVESTSEPMKCVALGLVRRVSARSRMSLHRRFRCRISHA